MTVKRMNRLSKAACIASAALALNLACAGSAWAYVGPSYVNIPGLAGGWKGAEYKNWIRADGHYWDGVVNAFGGMRRGMYYFSGPQGPKSGGGKLVLAFNKGNPILRKLMERCAKKAAVPELVFSEVSDLARAPQQVGPRPASIPAHFEYKLTDVQFTACPVAEGAPQQAIVLSFKESARINYSGEGEAVAFPNPGPLQLTPISAVLPGKSKSFVLTWFALAADVADDQCPVMNKKPTEDDYYRLVAKEDADKERAENAKKGGVNYENGQMGYRGPGKLDVTRMPGLVADPGNAAPQTRIARGFNLDGDDGTGKPPAYTNKHLNYVSPDGRTGIDNQLYTAQGCIASFMGRKGFIMQFSNKQMHDGMLSMIVEIAGIDDERNDDKVEVLLSYSLDAMAKSGSGAQILSDYTFRLTDKPMWTHYTRRLPGRIVDGVITIDPVERLDLNLGQYGTPNELQLSKAQLRLEVAADGTLKGTLGGYMDWRPLISRYISSTVENIHGFHVPGLYNALRRNADGMKNPLTGEYEGISSAYDIEGVPAFVEPLTIKRDVASAN